MDDAGAVRTSDTLGDLNREANRRIDRERSAVNQCRQRLADDVLHRDEVDPLVRVDLVDRDDVRMIEGRGGLGFAKETVLPLRVVGVLWREHLERDLALKDGVASFPHLPHAALAQLRGNDVLTQRAADHDLSSVGVVLRAPRLYRSLPSRPG